MGAALLVARLQHIMFLFFQALGMKGEYEEALEVLNRGIKVAAEKDLKVRVCERGMFAMWVRLWEQVVSAVQCVSVCAFVSDVGLCTCEIYISSVCSCSTAPPWELCACLSGV